MATSFKVVGRAVATARGHYPRPSGGSRRIEPGETFDVYDGLTKASWFTLDMRKAPAPPAPAPAQPDTLSAVAKAENARQGRRKPTAIDDIA